MRTRFGRISRGTIALGLVLAAVIATGMIWPGRTGAIIETVGWVALAACIIFEVGILQSASRNRDYDGNDRRP